MSTVEKRGGMGLFLCVLYSYVYDYICTFEVAGSMVGGGDFHSN